MGRRKLISNKTKVKAAKKAAPVVARGGVKAAKATGRHALRGAKTEANLARQAMSSEEPKSTRYAKYALFALAGLAFGSLIGRAGGKSETSSSLNYQAPGEANEVGADRDFSDPASGPLIGEETRPEMDMTERNQITEQRIRTGIGEQVDTKGLPKINVEVNDGVVDLRGPVPSDEFKQTIESVASNTQGVREVRNNLTVDSSV